MARKKDDDKTEDEIDQSMEEGELDEDVYTEEGRENLLEDDEIEEWEEGFMEGADELGQQGKCASCGGVLDMDNTVEEELEGELRWFCSERCAERFRKKHK
ncbi:MAG: DUF2116 family Zn-ribbon domain-containing protein [Nanoarchaeota archaeon]|nr:DUF2116 family Zn-ribbon domain-containing protein [Nanoarchaeota archaeon]